VQSTPLISSGGALVGIISTHGEHPPTRRQLDEITMLARRTANELVRSRALPLPELHRWNPVLDRCAIVWV